ncbi:molybdopterin-dependent oxidoreductase [Microbacterium sp. SSM24]|uniref:molybdopterin-dependent oxidoreductase n=1 Tax=Microbacterium sp. SSM24 TaxID=2991714 RepID=UPI002227CD6D|nr:molybdopterin-dependent oxidoreductase [Microbacterium sp. SSM24]MCW3493239.1 molybdopterin-dependent oxidoreductase [Microbacterium sp. SSM24]
MTTSRVDRGIAAPYGWAAGVGAVALGAGLGELVGAVVAPTSGPFVVVGGALIDAAPPWAKDAAIALFGTADKIALLIGIGLVVLVLAALAGWLELRRPPWGRAVVVAFGAVGAIAAVTRANAGALAWLPAVVAGIVGAFALWWLVRMLAPGAAARDARSGETFPRAPSGRAPAKPVASSPDRASRSAVTPDADDPSSKEALPGTAAPSRRSFLVWSGAAVVAGVVAAAAGTAMRAGSSALAAIKAVVLPAPAVAAPPVPAAAELDIPGLARVVTPNDRFYRIDTALIVPTIDPADWNLHIFGMVEEEVKLTWDELLELPLVEAHTTLACVSNEVGGTLIGNALWLGYPIRDLLARARPTAEADMVLSRSRDGFTASTPLDVLTDDRDALLAIGMNGEPLPPEHGFPARLVVPGLYGYVSATKWVKELEVTRFDRARAYWTDRGWSERGPIKLQSRIDVPRKSQGLTAGDTVIAGVAWQQHVGVAGVEVQIDEGPWQPATLAAAISTDTWVQWHLPWTAVEGDHLIRCRAISATGEVQTSDRAHPAPDGASGWHERFVSVFA